MKIEYVEDTNTEDPIEEVKQVEDIKIVSEDQVEEAKPQPDFFHFVEESFHVSVQIIKE